MESDSDFVSKIIKENNNLMIQNKILMTKQKLYDILFGYMRITWLWFHSFIMFFSKR